MGQNSITNWFAHLTSKCHGLWRTASWEVELFWTWGYGDTLRLTPWSLVTMPDWLCCTKADISWLEMDAISLEGEGEDIAPPSNNNKMPYLGEGSFFFFLHRGFLGTQHSLSKVWIREEKKNISLNKASLGPKRKTVWIFFFYLRAFVCWFVF